VKTQERPFSNAWRRHIIDETCCLVRLENHHCY
jgi:hypothetical protein